MQAEVDLPDFIHLLFGIFARLLAFALPGSWGSGSGSLTVDRVRSLVLLLREFGIVKPFLPFDGRQRVPSVTNYSAEYLLPLLDGLRDTAVPEEIRAKVKEPVGRAARGLASGNPNRILWLLGDRGHVVL